MRELTVSEINHVSGGNDFFGNVAGGSAYGFGLGAALGEISRGALWGARLGGAWGFVLGSFAGAGYYAYNNWW